MIKKKYQYLAKKDNPKLRIIERKKAVLHNLVDKIVKHPKDLVPLSSQCICGETFSV